jgi:hypothetical protein
MALLTKYTPPPPELALPTTFLRDREAQIIEKALRAHGPEMSVHGWLSGGGLRVLSFRRRDGREVDEETGKAPGVVPSFYAEAPQIKDAWRILADDVMAGGRPYEDVYGRTEPQCLTGTGEASCGLDVFLRGGASVDVWCKPHSVLCRVRTLSRQRAPRELTDRAAAGETGLTWTDSRGFTYLFEPQSIGPSKGCAILTVGWPEGRTKAEACYTHWRCSLFGGAGDEPNGNNLGLAIARAVVAEEAEDRS